MLRRTGFNLCPAHFCRRARNIGGRRAGAAGGSFLVVIDADCFEVGQIIGQTAWLPEAEVILVRCALGFFWSGKGDLSALAGILAKHGFIFYDVLEYFRLHLLNAPADRITLVFENQKSKPGAKAVPDGRSAKTEGEADASSRVGRTQTALTFLSNPIARAASLNRLAGCGSFGFAGGVFNPGAIAEGERVLLLARGEAAPWHVSKRNLQTFLSGYRPLLLELDGQLKVSRTETLAFSHAEGLDGFRAEDFRLFRYRGELYANHSRIMAPDGKPARAEAVRLETLQIQTGISRVNAAQKELTFLGTPTLDCATQRAEKNWVLFESEKELYLIYSFNPYHLLRASQWPRLDFTTVFRQAPGTLPGSGGVKFRNSVNPAEYDPDYFLHVVHNIYPGKQYAYWAVLIDRKTLQPARIGVRPLACGWRSAPARIIYLCAVVPRREDVLFFGGFNDSSTGVWRVSRRELDENWAAINPSSPMAEDDGEKRCSPAAQVSVVSDSSIK